MELALPIPADLLADVTNCQVTDDMTFGEQTASGQPLLDHIVTTLDLQGEIAGAGVVRNGRTALNIARPGLVKQIEVDVRTQEATITELRQGLFGTMAEKFPDESTILDGHLRPQSSYAARRVLSIVWLR